MRSLRAGDFFCPILLPKRRAWWRRAHIRTEGEIRAIVQRFEGCDFRIEEFTHARHLTVAAWYLMKFPPDDARVRMRTGLLRFLDIMASRAITKRLPGSGWN